jgi:thiosulfate dehydrogenase (quinone) large subunit
VSSAGASFSFWQQILLVTLRFAIGWHLFYQGFGKVVAVEWSSADFLRFSWGPFAWMAEQPTLLAIADFMVIWGLMILGVLLMVGLFTRIAAVLGGFLVLLFYLAAPPLDFTGFVMPGPQGTELYVDKNLIEVLALWVLAAFPTGRMIGLDIIFESRRSQP